jgi:hypothetical protein
LLFSLEGTGHRAREQRCPAFCSPCLPQNNFEICVRCQRAHIELCVPSVVVVAVVSGELAQPEIKTAVGASAAATSLFLIALISELARKRMDWSSSTDFFHRPTQVLAPWLTAEFLQCERDCLTLRS